MNNSSKYGHFSPDGKEYIVTNPRTPLPWINYLVNKDYFSLISHTGGGYSFVTEPIFNRITREYPGDNISFDRPGRYVYIRDNENGEYWSVNWQPICKNLDFWEARVGLGYHKISSMQSEIQAEITYFVPLKERAEFWMIKIKNNSGRKRDLSIFTYVEWCLGSYIKDLTDRSFDSLFNDVYFEDNIIFATKRRWDRPWPVRSDKKVAWDKWAFITGNTKFDGFDCVKVDFIGQYQYLSNPISVENGECQNTQGESEDAIGTLMKKISLEDSEEIKFDIMLGALSSKEEIRKFTQTYSDHDLVAEKFQELNKYWQEYLSQLTVKTPDSNLDLSINIWNKYQAWITAQVGEMDSYYLGGSSFGFRDQSQHIYGVLPHDSEFVKGWVQVLLEHQFNDGKTVHSWNPTTGEGVVTGHSDDAQWLVMTVLNYVKETGDLDFFNQNVKYLDEGQGTVLQHIEKALDYTLFHVSPNGVPLRRTADWNDALAGGHLGKGESMMVANQVCFNIKELIPILKKLPQKNSGKLVERYEHVYERLKETLNHDYWDGAWYLRATDDQGKKIGSKENREGKIHLEGQTWPIISSVADKERGIQAMDQAWKHLDTPYGLVIFTSPYTHLNEGLGIISQFAPGTKENGTIFTHTNSWAVIAECILGRGEKAYEIFQKTSFITRGKNPDVYQAEPYAYCEFTYGPTNPHFGRGSYSWMTGSASWFYRVCTDWILGVRPTIEGLLIDPCIPAGWESFEIKRNFRGATYHIKVKNPLKVNKGVQKITVDRKEITGNLLPDLKKGSHNIEVVMG